MNKDLETQLLKTGTAEISNGIVTQITQAIDETDKEVKILIFGELRTEKIIPIEQACAKCKPRFNDVKLCQSTQKKDAQARGFTKLICPRQFDKKGG
jgi:hypothetical protein